MDYIIIIIQTIILILTVIFSSYFSKKGEDLATKEDIGEITDKVEEIKKYYRDRYDLSVNEREFYNEMIDVVQTHLSQIKRYELEHFNSQKDSVTKEIVMKDDKLREQFLTFADSASTILAKAFVFLDEESYTKLLVALKKEKTFASIRLNLLDAMRQSIHPETQFVAREDSRDVRYMQDS